MESSEPETVLESLMEVAELQRDRVLAMFAEEMKRDLVNHHLNASHSSTVIYCLGSKD
jgi:hypothetical protein